MTTIEDGQARIGPDDATSARFAQAARHSARVRRMRRWIPIGTGLAMAAIVVVAVVDPFRRSLPGVDFRALNLTGTRITMELPKLSGFRRDNRPYEVTARTATQDIRNPQVIDLRDLEARLTLDADGSAKLTARSGVYDTQKELLDLADDVRLVSNAGYDVRLASARIDFKGGTVVSEQPVDVRMRAGQVNADRLDIVDNGRKIVFSGRVRAVMEPDGADDAQPREKGVSP